MTRLESARCSSTATGSVEERGRLGPARAPRVAWRRVDIPADLPLVPVDGVLIEQALVNLLENAVKYTDATCPIAVAEPASLSRSKQVSDEGPGLRGVREQVFEKFYRAHSARGVGLGLPICRAIATAHAEKMWAERREPRGTRFRLTLPLGTAPPGATEEDA